MEAIHAVFDDLVDENLYSLMESIREDTPECQFIPRLYCPLGHGSPTPRPVYLTESELQTAKIIVEKYAGRLVEQPGQISLDDLIDGGSDDAFDLFDRQRSISVEDFQSMIKEFGDVRDSLSHILTPGCLLGPLRKLSHSPVEADVKLLLRLGNVHHLIASKGSLDDLTQREIKDIALAGEGDLRQLFVISDPLPPQKSGYRLTTCPVCHLPIDQFPQGSLRMSSESLPQMFYFYQSGMLFVRGDAAEWLSGCAGVRLEVWGGDRRQIDVVSNVTNGVRGALSATTEVAPTKRLRAF